jgi:hypothetical protein
LSDTAELENAVRHHDVEASRAIVAGPMSSPHPPKNPTTGLITAVATGREGVGQLLAVKVGPIAGVTCAGGTGQRGSGKELS